MFGRLGKDAGSLLGVEIAFDSIRIAQIRRRRGHCERVAWAFQAFEPCAGGDGWQAGERVVAALRSAYQQCGSRQRRAAVAVSASQVICKVCHLPVDQTESQIEAQLLADADRLFPFPLEDLVLDFQVLGVSRAQPGNLDILVGASRQAAMLPYETLFEEAGLQLEAVEIDSIALRRLLPRRATGAPALLRLEPGSSTLHGWLADALPQRRELPPGMPMARLGDVFDTGASPDELLVVGAPKTEPQMLGRLSDMFGLPCRPLPPMDGLDCSDSSMTLACALALGSMA